MLKGAKHRGLLSYAGDILEVEESLSRWHQSWVLKSEWESENSERVFQAEGIS